MRVSVVLALTAAAAVSPTLARAQAPSAAPQSQVAPAVATPAASGTEVLDYQMGPGDELSVSVSGVRQFSYSTRVSNSGRIRVPYVGVLYVAGQTATDVEQQVARLIKEHELVNEPSVRVQVDSYHARPAYVIGEVTTPGQFVVTGEMYVLDLLAKAGGVVAQADGTIYVYRHRFPRPGVEMRMVGVGGTAPPAAAPEAPAADSDPAGPESVTIDLDALRSGTKPELNLRIDGGDVIYVPRRKAQNVYIIGDVKVPGAYTLPRRGEISAAQAVIYAGGPLATAAKRKGFIMRHNAAGVREAVPVDFQAILDGRQPDVTVRANDIIYIPNGAVKTVGIGLLNLIPRLIQQFAIF